MTVKDQIQNLKEKGLEISNEEYAESVLSSVSYFRLIKAYSLGLKPRNGRYHPGVTFEQIVSLYEFNACFRRTIFLVIEQIEVTLRCRIANHVSVRYGVLGYKNAQNFEDPDYHRDFMVDLGTEIDRNKKSPFVQNFLNEYENGDLPMYAAIELFSFGMLSKFFKNMKNEDKKEIASTYGVGYTYFESWIESIAYVRNICAHYGRIYNATITKRPKLYKQYNHEKRGYIYDVLLCMGRLVEKEDWVNFVRSVQDGLLSYPNVQISTMGFPDNWVEQLMGLQKPAQMDGESLIVAGSLA